MLLSLSIKHFKSIREAHIRFGPFTCFTGHNGVGKSNLFDAIHFLAALADRDVSGAATEVRRTSDGGYSPLDLVFGRDPERRIELCARMVVPSEVEDDFGQAARPSASLLIYTIRLRYEAESDRLLVEHESLMPAKLGAFRRFIGFTSSQEFRRSVVVGGRRRGPLISTREDRIQLHGDGGSRGRPSPVGRSPLTVVGGTNTRDYPTVLAAKREMASWRILHLEPSAMRTPDSRSAPTHVSASGRHIPATLHALVARDPAAEAEILFRLQQLNSDIAEIGVHSDDVRDQLALRARIPGVENWLYGRSLSDGTLRYIALVLMLVDVQDRAVLCIEEPENGIYPSRMPNLAELLRDYAVDPGDEVGPDNPLRQVVLNTHSPEVARQLSFDDLVFVERALTKNDGPVSAFRPVTGTWRASLSGGEESTTRPIGQQAVVDFIGGSPVNPKLRQLAFEFGSAR